MGGGLGQGLDGCGVVKSVCVVSLDVRSRYLYIVLCGYLRILGAPSVQSVGTYPYLLANVYLSVADISNPNLFACSCRTWICLDIAHFYEEQCQPSTRVV